MSRDGVSVGIAAGRSMRGFSGCNEMVGKGGCARGDMSNLTYKGSESQAGVEVTCRGQLTLKTMLVKHTLNSLSE